MTENDNAQGMPHKRRERYSGKYPRRFDQKYKELNPERYQDTVEKVIAKGSTPAGMHIPIMPEEILAFLQVQPGMCGLDCTLGYGGHSTRLLEALHGSGHLYSLDADPIEIEKTEKRLRGRGFSEDIFTPIHINFRFIDEVAEKYGPFDFLMADLGVSSMQIDNPERGFSYKVDGPLDLRFNPRQGESAAQRLASLEKEDIAFMLSENADEPYADEIAAAVTRAYRQGRKIETTSALREVIAQALSRLPEKERDAEVKKSCARTFQALRIDVNSEFEVLYEFLEKLPHVLSPGGRAAILTFHSGEDRLVKKAFKAGLKQGLYADIADDVVRPSKEECFRNPRAHSTKMRWAVAAGKRQAGT